MNELMSIGAFVEAVLLRFWDLVSGGRGHHNSSGCCCEWDGRPLGVITNGEFRVPSVVPKFDAPESILGVAPPSEDGLYVVGDFAPMLVEEDFAAGIAEDSDREEVVDEAGQSVGEACVGG
jgi:hypothetical protein